MLNITYMTPMTPYDPKNPEKTFFPGEFSFFMHFEVI